MKRKLKKLLAVMLAVLAMCSTMTQTASAHTSGGENSRTIIVETKANYFYPGSSSITLKQTKPVETYKKLTNSGKTKTKTVYGVYEITYTAIGGKYAGKDSGSVKMTGQTCKLNLKPNTTYKITVTYDSIATWKKVTNACPLGYTWSKSSGHSWKVSSTWKLASYY